MPARRRLRLHAALGSLALGGAERIVLDWSASAARQHTVCLAVLRDTKQEWAVPPGVKVVRLQGRDIQAGLTTFGAEAVAGGTPVVLCHLLKRDQRQALAAAGALPVPVLHNAEPGWLEPAHALRDSHLTIAVAQAVASEYRAAGGRVPCIVVRHFPRPPRAREDARRFWRARWSIPADAHVIGMIGAVKPQKAYTRALRALAELSSRHVAYLVILGGPIGRDGALAWNAILAQAQRLGIAEYVRLPGFVPDASQCLPAFDAFLNTSRYEGLSVATLEALACGMPVVASRVGGQGEVAAPGLRLLAFEGSDAQWAEALSPLHRAPSSRPGWIGFPSERQWTLCHLARPFKPGRGVLFVTANLNAGGAQRSLVNLALALNGKLAFEIAITGNSSASAFARTLSSAAIPHFRSADSRDCFDHAEALIAHIVDSRPASVCFWNVDAKVKLLLVKWLGFTRLKFIDVSPGADLFEEMAATGGFQDCIAYSQREYFRRLDRLVHKYQAPRSPEFEARTMVIANGVPAPRAIKNHFGTRPAKVAVSGRIAPSKFLLEAIAAMRLLWQHEPDVQLHLLGSGETRHRDYVLQVAAVAGADSGERVFCHGAVFDAPERLAQHDAILVLGANQGCPNTVLEALAAGVPVVANDSGGTRDLVIHEKTGMLLEAIDPQAVAAALRRVLKEPEFARRLSAAGRKHVMKKFSMERMRSRYLRLFG